MIKTPNYLITEIKEFKIPRFESMGHRLFLFDPQINYYRVSDLGGVGAKYLVAHHPGSQNVMVKSINNYKPFLSEELEIIAGLNEMIGPIYYQDYQQPEGTFPKPTLSEIENRNEILQTTLASFNWLVECNLYFTNGFIFFKSFNPNFFLTLKPFCPFILEESEKSLMVEHEIYEQDFLKLTTALTPLYHDIKSTILDNLVVNYSKAEGLK